MSTVREQLLQRFPPVGRVSEPDGIVATAVYSMIGSIEGLVVDGWSLFRIAQESDASIDAIGLMTLLPTGAVPMFVNIKTHERGLAWSVVTGRQDEHWLALSNSKRWNSVYLFAGGDRQAPAWEWGERYEGVVAPEND